MVDWHALGFEPVAVLDNYEDALNYMQSQPVDVLLTDIRLGERLGLDLVRDAQKIHTRLESVLISAYSEFNYAQDAIALKVFEYLLKPISIEDMIRCFSRLYREMEKRNPVKTETGKHETSLSDIPSNAYYIRIAKAYIDEHYSEDLSLESVAMKLSLNAKYLSHYFKQQTHENLTRYLSRIRMRKAVELLQDSTVKLSGIYQMVGYRSKSQFYDVFYRETGYTPADYRNRLFGAGIPTIHQLPAGPEADQ